MILCAQEYNFTILAGAPGVSGSANGIGFEARFDAPTAIAVDDKGFLYATEYRNGMIRKIAPNGTVNTLAGVPDVMDSMDGVGANARFSHGHGVTVDHAGTLYVCDFGNSVIRKITADGTVTTLAGKAGSTGDSDGSGSDARFDHPEGIAVASNGTIYVADTYNFAVRRISPEGVVTTLAGLAGKSGSADGQAAEARFDTPIGIAIGADGILYVADGRFDASCGNSTIRKITPDGVVTTLAGFHDKTGNADGTGSAARFRYPVGIAVDKAGTIYLADTGNSTIRMISAEGVVTTIAGQAGVEGHDGGAGLAATFRQPQGIAVDGHGNLYVADTLNHVIRKGSLKISSH